MLALQAQDFNPEKYESLSQLLCKVYCSEGNPADMLKLYLSVLLKGTCSVEDNGIFSVMQFDKVTSYSCVPAKGDFFSFLFPPLIVTIYFLDLSLQFM